jgi:hypothetical protein
MTQTTITRDNLFAGTYDCVRGEVTVADSQTLTRGAVMGIVGFEAGTAAADAGNTGDGAISAFALVAGGNKKVGTYLATCTAAATDAGTFQVTDPEGTLVGQMEVGTTFSGGGITFALADGATDFIVGDAFDLPVDAGSGEAKALDITAIDGSENFYGILLEDVTTSGATQLAPVGLSGEYQTQGLSFGGSTVYGDVIDDARDKNCYFKVTVATNNAIGD